MERSAAKNRASLAGCAVLGQLKEMAKLSAANREASSDSAQMQLDQNSNMANNGDRWSQDAGSNAFSSGVKMNHALLHRQMGLGGSLIQQLLMANLLGDNGIGLQNKFVAGI